MVIQSMRRGGARTELKSRERAEGRFLATQLSSTLTFMGHVQQAPQAGRGTNSSRFQPGCSNSDGNGAALTQGWEKTFLQPPQQKHSLGVGGEEGIVESAKQERGPEEPTTHHPV